MFLLLFCSGGRRMGTGKLFQYSAVSPKSIKTRNEFLAVIEWLVSCLPPNTMSDFSADVIISGSKPHQHQPDAQMYASMMMETCAKNSANSTVYTFRFQFKPNVKTWRETFRIVGGKFSALVEPEDWSYNYSCEAIIIAQKKLFIHLTLIVLERVRFAGSNLSRATNRQYGAISNL